ncbi:CRTAC1 family protein [Actinoallomurus rhizosphaericola]|uniref:CRTAC1 family protein n=1 Tax=Actinoallomurus rhizosphaericola TaxID=2952536 RepID=UPI002093A3C6|nr:CRTAC1 family protein [Actinoallomurus rhizosphaericola]MCO5998060.1 CRTAC1 family protein [Actinoallomurus rhizosphaericola]
MKTRTNSCLLGTIALLVVLISACGSAQKKPADSVNAGITFRNIAVPGTTLAAYRRCVTGPEHQKRVNNKKRLFITMNDFTDEPMHDRGIPGVVIFDYNNDGYQDIFVSNGPCRPSSLYENMMGTAGKLEFRDVAAQAGLALPGFNANGACAGDINNSGYESIYVLGRNGPNHLLLNEGNGHFKDITQASGAEAGVHSHISCTMGDFSGNGRLDIAIANSSDMKNAKAIMKNTADYNQPNQLLQNMGGNAPRFRDVSVSSGFATTTPLPGQTWAIAAVDLFQNGCTDIVAGTDQGAVPMTKYGGGGDRGFIRVYKNDCHGRFTDVTRQVGLMSSPGAWMGFAFGNFNFNGKISIFGTNFGDFLLPMYGLPQNLGDLSSRWILQRPNGTFADPRSSTFKYPAKSGADPSLGGLHATPFGWGVAALDYDNDGSTDIAYAGSMDGMNGADADNPGTLLRNNGPKKLIKGFYPSFSYDPALANDGADDRRRIITGVAAGDLDNDGHADLVTAAQGVMVGKLTEDHQHFGSPFDDSRYLAEYTSVGVMSYKPAPGNTTDGTLAVEMNKGGNGNNSAAVRTLGAVGLVPGAKANRDGVGAVVGFTPAGLPTQLDPVVAGSSYASQNSLVQTFGMGKSRTGTLEVLWPGGVRNKLFDVQAGERITFPEIPCSYTDKSMSVRDYTSCVRGSLDALVHKGKVSGSMAARFTSSALKAFNEAHQPG